jgi:hypothetical protein
MKILKATSSHIAMTSHSRKLIVGESIITSDSSSICRDVQGRTRREASLNLLGAAAQTSAPKLITIVDPVAGFRYTLDSENKIARRFAIHFPGAKGSGFGVPGQGGISAKGERVMIYQRVGTAGPDMVMNDNVFFQESRPSLRRACINDGEPRGPND